MSDDEFFRTINMDMQAIQSPVRRSRLDDLVFEMDIPNGLALDRRRFSFLTFSTYLNKRMKLNIKSVRN